MVTFAACREKNTAAWPAELAPPTMITWSPAQDCGLGRRRAVVDAAADQIVGAGRLELAIADPGGQHHRVGQHRAAVVEGHLAGGALRLEADDRSGGQQLGAEAERLPPGPVGQLIAGHAVGKAEVVLDPRALAGLAAGRRPFHDDGLQSLRGRVHRRAEPGRAAADDHQVVELALRAWC